MGISTRYFTAQPIIERNSKGFLSIKNPQMGRPFVTRIIQPPVDTGPLPTRQQILQEIEALERAEKTPEEGLLALIASWISDFVNSFFGHVPPSTENSLLDAKERDITPLSPTEVIPKSETQKLPIDCETVPEISSAIKDLRLTSTDKVHTATNMFHWGITGATLYGVAPQITVPLSIMAGLSAEAISFLSLPKDTHWLRKLFSFPGLAGIIINYNPWIARLFQATSFFNNAQHSTSKLATAWNAFKDHPKEALKAGTAHLFNLVSDTFFTAKSLGLLSLSPKNKPLRIRSPDNRTELSIGLVYEDGKPEIREIADLVGKTHQEYADRWKVKNTPFITTRDYLKGKCVIPFYDNPRDPSPTYPKIPVMGDCSVYWPKIPVAIDWVKDHMSSGKDEVFWLIDYDGPITNMKEDPLYWTEKWLANPDGSRAHIAVTKDAADWADHTFRGQQVDQRYHLNGGFWVIRNTPEALNLLENIWDLRNVVHNVNEPDCLTKGMCQNQKCLHEQEMSVRMLLDHPDYIDRLFRVVPQRDPESGIGINTSNRRGCFIRSDWKQNHPSSYRSDRFDSNWETGDIMGQPNGVPPRGYEGTIDAFGNCHLNRYENRPRIERIHDMISKTVR